MFFNKPLFTVTLSIKWYWQFKYGVNRLYVYCTVFGDVEEDDSFNVDDNDGSDAVTILGIKPSMVVSNNN